MICIVSITMFMFWSMWLIIALVLIHILVFSKEIFNAMMQTWCYLLHQKYCQKKSHPAPGGWGIYHSLDCSKCGRTHH